MPIITVEPNELLLNFGSDDFNKRFTNSTPKYEDMTPYVEFFAIKKNTIVNYFNNDSVSSDSFERIDLLGHDTTKDGEKVFTVRYLDVDPTNPSNNSKEAFGIKSIDIKTNASYVPTIDITFIDVKGLSYFAQNGNSSYGVLLDFPPPLFVLRIKGVFGLMVEYRLHLTKSNIAFNSKNGNYEIKCNFIGYNIAPFTDISTGLLTAVHFISPDLNGDIKIDQSNTPRSFFELLLKGDVLYNKLDVYKNNSTDFKDSKKYDENLDRVSDLRGKIDYLSNLNNFTSSFNAPDNNNFKNIIISDNRAESYIDIRLDYNQISIEEKQRITKLIEKYFNDYIESISIEFKDFNISTSDLKINSPFDQPVATSLNDLLLPPPPQMVNGFSIATPVEELNIKYFQLDYKSFFDKVDKKENELKQKKNKLLTKIQTNVGEISDIKVFLPTIKNIVEIVTKDIDRFFKLMVDAANKKKNSISGIKGNVRFPEYNEIKNVAGVTQTIKVYPGIKKEFSDWGEVQLVESIVNGLSRAQKTIERLDELQNIENGDSKWTPIIPFESKSENITKNEYFNQRININNIFENIAKRYCVAKNYTYKGYINNNEILDFVARAEARNLLYAVNNEDTIVQYLENFSKNYTESDITKFIELIPNDSLYKKNNSNINELTVNGIKVEQKFTSIAQDTLNTNFQGLSLVTEDEVNELSLIEDENKVAQLIDSVKDLTVPFISKLTGSAKIEMCSDNLLVFIDGKKDSNPTIKTEYKNYDSNFFAINLVLIIQVIIEEKNKLNKELTFDEFFDQVLRDEHFISIYDDIVYKFFFPSLVEMPKVYLLYLGYLLSNVTNILLLDKTLSNSQKEFTEKLNSSLSVKDKELIINYYTDFKAENTLLLDEDFYKLYSGTEDKDTLIKTYIDLGEVSLMEKIYLMNSTPVTFTNFEPNKLTIPKTFTFFNNSVSFTANDIQFRTINANDTNDKKYFTYFFSEIRKQIQNIKKQKEGESNSTKNNFQDNDIKAALYYELKNLYDRWLSVPENQGDSINLYEELFGSNLANSFKYVDRTLNTTAQDAIMDFRDFVEDGKDFSINVYSLLTRFFSKNNFLFWPLQSSLVFDSKSNAEKWKNSFRLITDNVNSLKSKPNFVCMYINSFSSQLNRDNTYYPDDGLSFLTQYSPLSKENEFIITQNDALPKDYLDSPANIYVFIVSIGKQNQSIFTNISLSTAEFTDTYESLKLADLISRKNADSNPISKGQNLFNVLSQRSFSVTVEIGSGNMCIQPTMYFELVGTPMFNGGYIITEVEHSMNGDTNKLSTKFKGTRVGKVGLEMVTDPKIFYSNVLGLDNEIKEQFNNGPLDPNTYSIYNSMSELKI